MCCVFISFKNHPRHGGPRRQECTGGKISFSEAATTADPIQDLGSKARCWNAEPNKKQGFQTVLTNMYCTWCFLAGNHGEHRFLRFLLVFKQLWKFVGSDCWVLLKPGRRSRHWLGGLYLSDMQRVDDSYFQSKQTWAAPSFGVGG